MFRKVLDWDFGILTMEDEAPVVKVDDLIRWGNSFVPEYNQMADSPITRQSPFPFNQEINMKIAYWQVQSTSV